MNNKEMKECKKIISNLPNKVKISLLQYLACYYEGLQIPDKEVTQLVYESYIARYRNNILGYLEALKSMELINEYETTLILNYINIFDSKYKNLISFNCNVTIYENLLKFFEKEV